MSGKAKGQQPGTGRPRGAEATQGASPESCPPRRELRLVPLAALGVMLLTCVPYFIAAAPGYAGPGLHFQGFLWGIDDANVYRSYIRQHASGHFFAFDQYTTEPQNPHFVNLLFLTMGLVCRLTGLSSLLVYHLFRVVGGVILLYLVYLLAAEVGLGRRGRWLAFLLASFSSGLGWIVYRGVTEGSLAPETANRLAPIDVASGWVAMPEAVTFLTLLTNALFVTGVALMLAVMLWGIRAAGKGGWRATLVCGAWLFLLGNVHTYDVIVLYGGLGLFFLARAAAGDLAWSQAVARYVALTLMGAPTVTWQYYVQSVDPIWATKYLVPKTSPPVSGYLLGYGLLLGAALIGAVLAVTGRRNLSQTGSEPPRLSAAALPVIWMIVGFVLVYTPLNFQRKLAEGLHVPLCLLAALALEQWGRGRQASLFRLSVVLFLVVTVPSNVYYVADGLAHARVNNLDLAHVFYPPSYLSADELAGLRWLSEHATSGDIVMSSVQIGNYIPAAAPCYVVAGHWDETVRYGHYRSLMTRFYAPSSSPQTRRATLQESRAGLVFYGPQERLLQRLLHTLQPGSPEASDPAAGLPELREVFRQGEVVIYATVPAAA